MEREYSKFNIESHERVTRKQELVIVIQLQGSFIGSKAADFKDSCYEHIEKKEKKPAVLAIDCLGVDDFDSSALAALISILTYSKTKKIKMILFNLSYVVEKVLKGTFQEKRLNEFFSIMTRDEFEEVINA